jgi:phospholipid transport system transporter-binding protein
VNTSAVVKQDESGRFQLSGELSFLTVPDLVHRTRGLFDDSGDIEVDLEGVTRSDSAGLALLVEWMNTARHHDKQIQFLNIPLQMLAIARVSSLDQVLPLSGREDPN